MSAHALATRPTPVIDAADLIFDTSLDLSAALASAQAGLREARHRGLPPPLNIAISPGTVHITAPCDNVLLWWRSRLLDPVKVAAADYQRGRIRIEGHYDGHRWTLTSTHSAGSVR